MHHAHRDVFQSTSFLFCLYSSRLHTACIAARSQLNCSCSPPSRAHAHATFGTDSVLSFSSKEGPAVGIVDRFAIHHGHGSLDPCRGSTTAQNRRPWTKWSTFTHGSLQATSGFLLILGTPSSPFNLVQSSIPLTQGDHTLCRFPSVYSYFLCPHESRISALTSSWVLPKRRRNF